MRRSYVTSIYVEQIENGNYAVILRIPAVEVVIAEFVTEAKALSCQMRIEAAVGRDVDGVQRATFTPLSELR